MTLKQNCSKQQFMGLFWLTLTNYKNFTNFNSNVFGECFGEEPDIWFHHEKEQTCDFGLGGV